jgi:hypothetical protein
MASHGIKHLALPVAASLVGASLTSGCGTSDRKDEAPGAHWVDRSGPLESYETHRNKDFVLSIDKDGHYVLQEKSLNETANSAGRTLGERLGEILFWQGLPREQTEPESESVLRILDDPSISNEVKKAFIESLLKNRERHK